MSDTFNVTAAWGKPAYVAGETITGTISGENVHTSDPTVTHEAVGPVTIPYVAASGAQSTISLPAVDVTRTTAGTVVHEPVSIDVSLFATNQGGRVWTVAADRKSISAVA